MTPPPVQIRTNYLLAYDLLETAAWFSQLSAHADVHLDRIQRAVAHLRGQHVQSPPGQETPNTIHESPRRDMAWLLRNDPWAAAIAAHVRFCDQAALADEIHRLRAENERMVDAMHEANAKLYHEVESLRSALAAAQEAPSETDAAAKEQWRSNPPYPVWLVERTDNGYAEWLKSSIGDALVWTTEASEALWHETEDEAHAMIRSVRSFRVRFFIGDDGLEFDVEED